MTHRLCQRRFLNGGSVNGGADTDTLDYSAYTTGVSANLGLTVSGLAATLAGDQEVPRILRPLRAQPLLLITTYSPGHSTLA